MATRTPKDYRLVGSMPQDTIGSITSIVGKLYKSKLITDDMVSLTPRRRRPFIIKPDTATDGEAMITVYVSQKWETECAERASMFPQFTHDNGADRNQSASHDSIIHKAVELGTGLPVSTDWIGAERGTGRKPTLRGSLATPPRIAEPIDWGIKGLGAYRTDKKNRVLRTSAAVDMMNDPEGAARARKSENGNVIASSYVPFRYYE